MKKFLLLVSVMLSTVAFAQGHETFDNLVLEGNTYQTGSFVGQDGITWSFGEARGDIEINGTAITLGRNRENPMFLESGIIPNGVGTLQFSYMQAFSTNVGMEVLVNGELVYTATSDGEQEVVKSTGEITIDVPGDITLRFNNPSGVGQITIDDIIWTAAGTVGVEDNTVVEFSYFPNPMQNILNLKSSTSIENVETYNMLGQKVIGNSNFANGQVDVSGLPAGSYIFKVQFENGSQKTFTVSKQ